MILLTGILGAAVLFALFAFSATRSGTRLEESEGGHGGTCSSDSCSLQETCEGCEHAHDGAGWWPDDEVTYGDRR